MAICEEIGDNPNPFICDSRRNRPPDIQVPSTGWGDTELEDRQWKNLLDSLKGMGMLTIDFEVFKPVVGLGDGPTYTWSTVLSVSRDAKPVLAHIIKINLNEHSLCKPWYYRNAIEDEIEGWGLDMYDIVRHSVVELWEHRLSRAKTIIDPANVDGTVRQDRSEELIFTQKRLNIATARLYMSILWQMTLVEWSRVVPLPTLGPRPIILKAMLRDFHGLWKDAALKKAIDILTNLKDPLEAERDLKNHDWTSSHWVPERESDYIINYPDIRVNDQKSILSFPKKEVAGLGLDIAQKLGLGVPNTLRDITLPLKYFKGTPQVGDAPLPGSFPSTFSEFTNEDVFWLVAFYNEPFALQCRSRKEKPSDHVFEVWWHLSYMATHDGKLPDRDLSESQRIDGEGEKLREKDAGEEDGV